MEEIHPVNMIFLYSGAILTGAPRAESRRPGQPALLRYKIAQRGLLQGHRTCHDRLRRTRFGRPHGRTAAALRILRARVPPPPPPPPPPAPPPPGEAPARRCRCPPCPPARRVRRRVRQEQFPGLGPQPGPRQPPLGPRQMLDLPCGGPPHTHP